MGAFQLPRVRMPAKRSYSLGLESSNIEQALLFVGLQAFQASSGKHGADMRASLSS